jgi:hypothetical protein
MYSTNQEREVFDTETGLSERSVSFFPRVSVITGLHINNYTPEEVDACWLKMKDVMEFKKEIRYTVDLIERNLDIDDEKYCRRGIECRTRAGANHKRHQRMNALESVLKEQIVQYVEDLQDEQQIAMVYREAAYASKMVAFLTGLSDAKIAVVLVGSKPQCGNIDVRHMQPLIEMRRRLSSAAA